MPCLFHAVRFVIILFDEMVGLLCTDTPPKHIYLRSEQKVNNKMDNSTKLMDVVVASAAVAAAAVELTTMASY